MKQATAATPTTSNSKDDGNCMTACNSRKTSNSRNEINNRTANTVGTTANAGTLTVVMPATPCREANYTVQQGHY